MTGNLGNLGYAWVLPDPLTHSIQHDGMMGVVYVQQPQEVCGVESEGIYTIHNLQYHALEALGHHGLYHPPLKNNKKISDKEGERSVCECVCEREREREFEDKLRHDKNVKAVNYLL